jgi:hypothetical protein
VIGHDEDRGGVLRAIEFPRIKGAKPFDPATPWFGELLAGIGQPRGATVEVGHWVEAVVVIRSATLDPRTTIFTFNAW